MSLYNMLFGMNSQSDLLLAVIGFRKVDVERFRDVSVMDDGEAIAVYARTGGGNREGYPQKAMTSSPLYLRDEDDDFDSTYATFYFRTPPEFVADVRGLSDPLATGIRPEFGAHLLATLRRDPTEADQEAAAYEAERATLARTQHFMANGHTFVPKDDWAMETALKLAEANGGSLLSAWGIMPLVINVKTNERVQPGAKDATSQYIRRVEVQYDYGWRIDEAYWTHCQTVFGADYPVAMAKIAEAVEQRRARAA
ncbi:MAG: hypothetical protein ACK4RV_10425 [Caulobacter sp.]